MLARAGPLMLRVEFGSVSDASGSTTAVVVSGGKQFRVAAGDRILVDRLAAEPGSELDLGPVLMVAEAGETKVLPAELEGQRVTAKVLRHTRGPKIDVLRYKSKKRIRVRRGARADLTSVEILAVGRSIPPPQAEASERAETAPAAKPRAPRARSATKKAAAAAAVAPED